MTPTDPDMDAAVDAAAVPASEVRGNPGHDRAQEMARGARLLKLRSARLTYAEIAEQEGYADAASARNALIRALQRHEAENAVELRALENMALDQDERALRTIIASRDTSVGARIRAIDARVRLSARRARMNGLDAPVAVQISAGVQAALEDALTELDTVVGEVIQIRSTPPELEPGTDEALEA